MYRIAGILICLLPASIGASDYKPVRCGERQPYEGRPVHAAIRVTPGAIADTEPDPATVARLDAALVTIRAATRAPALTVAVGIEGSGVWMAGDDVPPSLVACPTTKKKPDAGRRTNCVRQSWDGEA